jgi:hypothetical protein
MYHSERFGPFLTTFLTFIPVGTNPVIFLYLRHAIRRSSPLFFRTVRVRMVRFPPIVLMFETAKQKRVASPLSTHV